MKDITHRRLLSMICVEDTTAKREGTRLAERHHIQIRQLLKRTMVRGVTYDKELIIGICPIYLRSLPADKHCQFTVSSCKPSCDPFLKYKQSTKNHQIFEESLIRKTNKQKLIREKQKIMHLENKNIYYNEQRLLQIELLIIEIKILIGHMMNI